MSSGLRRAYNIQSNTDPLWYSIQQKWYLPRHHRIFKSLYQCGVCGKPTLTNKPCSIRCKNKQTGELINVQVISNNTIRGTESDTA
jgi:hypothetical protein